MRLQWLAFGSHQKHEPRAVTAVYCWENECIQMCLCLLYIIYSWRPLLTSPVLCVFLFMRSFCTHIYFFFYHFFLSIDFRPPPIIPPNRGGGHTGGGGSSSSSTGRGTTTRSPPYYTTPRPLLTTSPGQRYRTTTTVRQPILVPAGGSVSDSNQIPDTNQKAGGSPPVIIPPAVPQPPALPPQDFCSPRVTADISWPRTQQGQTAKQPCPVGTLGKRASTAQVNRAYVSGFNPKVHLKKALPKTVYGRLGRVTQYDSLVLQELLPTCAWHILVTGILKAPTSATVPHPGWITSCRR